MSYRDLQVVPPVDTIPPADLDQNWWDTTCAVVAGKFKPRERVKPDEEPGAATTEQGATGEGDADPPKDDKSKKTE